jgi:hypothetical protein
METSNKKEIFKLLIKEFHSEKIPFSFKRELEFPFPSKKTIAIFGPRRSGKSFYFYSLIEDLLKKGVVKERILYLNFEDDRILPLSVKDLNSLVEAYFELYPENKKELLYLFFDEIQNIDEWEVFIRRLYEKEKVGIFITGSSSKLLSKEIATSLRGRTLSFPLWPLEFKEFLRFKGINLERDFEYTSQRFKVKNLLKEYIEWGGFPEVVLEKDSKLKKKILSEYFSLLLFRDIADRFSLKNLSLLRKLLKYLFTNITSLFSVNSYYRSIKQVMSVSRQTLCDYLDFIQQTDYFSLLPLFSFSLKVQRVNPRKIICLDNGLRNTVSFRLSKDEGRLVENLVGIILKKNQDELFYWKEKEEVDFVVKQNKELFAINVSYGEKIEEREIISLCKFKKEFKGNVKQTIIITQDYQAEEIRKGVKIKFIPLWKWLLYINFNKFL